LKTKPKTTKLPFYILLVILLNIICFITLFQAVYGQSSPVATFTKDKAEAYTGEIINFNASGSYDPDGYIVTYKWDFGDGTIEEYDNTTVTASHSWVYAGEYTVTLTVIDNEGLSSSTSQTVTIYGIPAIPLYFPVGSSIQFQNEINISVTIEVLSGVLSSEVYPTIILNKGGGEFQFVSANNTKVKISYSQGSLTVKIGGDNNHPLRVISSGATVTIANGNTVQLIWDRPMEPWLPMMFIFGMVGLGAMIGGPLYAINKIKKREYLEALRTGTIVTVIGIALFIAWLW